MEHYIVSTRCEKIRYLNVAVDDCMCFSSVGRRFRARGAATECTVTTYAPDNASPILVAISVGGHQMHNQTSSSAVAKRPCNASCLSVVSFVASVVQYLECRCKTDACKSVVLFPFTVNIYEMFVVLRVTFTFCFACGCNAAWRMSRRRSVR